MSWQELAIANLSDQRFGVEPVELKPQLVLHLGSLHNLRKSVTPNALLQLSLPFHCADPDKPVGSGRRVAVGVG